MEVMHLGLPTPLGCYWHQLAECFDNLKISSGTTRNQGDKHMQGLHCSTQGRESPGLQGFRDNKNDCSPMWTIPRWSQFVIYVSSKYPQCSSPFAYAVAMYLVHRTEVCKKCDFILLQLNLNSRSSILFEGRKWNLSQFYINLAFQV